MDYRGFVRAAIVLAALLALVRSGALEKAAESIASRPLPTPQAPAPEKAYYLVESLPSRESLPQSFNQQLGACLHINYESIFGAEWSREAWKVLFGAAAQGSRCALVYLAPEDAAHVDRLKELLGVAQEMGISTLVLRVHVRIRPRVFEEADTYTRAEGLDLVQKAAYALGGWVIAWQNAGLGEELARQGIYVQIFNEPNVAEEWDNPPADRFQNGLYSGDLRELGRRICLLHALYTRLLFPPIVRVSFSIEYDTSVPQPLLVIPDIAAATPEQKEGYLTGCLSSVADVAPSAAMPGGVSRSEYMVYTLRGLRLVYGMHLYAPTCDSPPVAIAEAMKREHVDRIYSVLNRYQIDGKPFISQLMVTEFGGAFTPTSGCDRKKQKDLYLTFTTMYPSVPAFWWVFAGNECKSGTYSGNTRDDWNRAILISYRNEGGRIVFRACEG